MYASEKDGVTLRLRGGKIVHFPLIGNLCRQCGNRPETSGREVDAACAVIAPGQAKAATTPTEINTSHSTYGHTHEVRLKKTAELQGVNLSGELLKWRGCSMAKGLRKPIARSTHIRADKKLQRVFVDLSCVGRWLYHVSGESGTNSLCGMVACDLHECTSWTRRWTQLVRSNHS